METKQPFKALSRICLNNWHYIDRKVLTLSEGINFFTGHSGSGKSTVIDALQIVLYASTDGRGFFNKAAADDSDRTLIEYLRGMVNISENNEAQYLRNQNFSSTIVLELEQTNTKEKQCVGVVFDVDTSTNDVNRLFFWHTGELLKEYYRIGKRCLSSLELREYLQRTFSPERFYCGSSNERFRRQLYDIYLGGLDMEKFPRLFKRAIPFRMNIKLEEFVKEYICMEISTLRTFRRASCSMGGCGGRLRKPWRKSGGFCRFRSVIRITTRREMGLKCAPTRLSVWKC